jgi:hypothetical protein
VLVLQKNPHPRPGITTDTGAFRQISVRRIVDTLAGIGSNPYIGG